MTLIWSYNPPEEVGWYWWRGDEDSSKEFWRPYYIKDMEQFSEPYDTSLGQWAGPIPYPEEPSDV